MMKSFIELNKLNKFPKLAKDDKEWLLNALSCDYDRRFLNYLMVDKDGTGYATDGHRLHICKDIGMDQGYYSPAGENVTDFYKGQYTYPEIENVMPKRKIPVRYYLSGEDSEVVKLSDGHMVKNKNNQYGFNIRYLQHALDSLSLIGYLDGFRDEDYIGAPFVFDITEKRTVILMPARA